MIEDKPATDEQLTDIVLHYFDSIAGQVESSAAVAQARVDVDSKRMFKEIGPLEMARPVDPEFFQNLLASVDAAEKGG